MGCRRHFAAPNSISGNITTDVFDGGRDGATLATVGPTALYQAQIDGVTVATLWEHPFSLLAPAETSNTVSASFGPINSAIPVAMVIGIQLRFSLTAHDTASISSRFDVVEPVVEEVPDAGSSAVLLAIALSLVATVSALTRTAS